MQRVLPDKLTTRVIIEHRRVDPPRRRLVIHHLDLSLSDHSLPAGRDGKKTPEAGLMVSAKISLAKHYRVVMFAYSFKEVGARLRTAASMKWMKWMGRSPVERAAAASFS